MLMFEHKSIMDFKPNFNWKNVLAVEVCFAFFSSYFVVLFVVFGLSRTWVQWQLSKQRLTESLLPDTFSSSSGEILRHSQACLTSLGMPALERHSPSSVSWAVSWASFQ
ncbi:hypothetical protein CRENBAI_003496 [Crenichthys baileyi]|uniref:ATP synthase F0 subunit 8 n=1 Tax=Crenichthys baileyi TaxID=28760 RepID=A0AAV9RVL5_9TELE